MAKIFRQRIYQNSYSTRDKCKRGDMINEELRCTRKIRGDMIVSILQTIKAHHITMQMRMSLSMSCEGKEHLILTKNRLMFGQDI